MSGLNALEKLRTAARNMAKGRNLENHEECNLLLLLADEIEAEIAERFVTLPVDEEGDVLRIGDELKCKGKSILLNSLSWDGCRWYATETVVSSGWYPVHLCRHVKPRTLEDVLCDALADVSCAGDGIRRKFEPDEPYVTGLAAEIRAMFGEVDHD